MGRSWLRPLLSLVLWTLVIAGLVAGSFVLLVLVFGRLPQARDRPLLVEALVSTAATAAILAAVHGRVRQAIDRASGAGRSAPSDLARSLSMRMSRAIPLDELALQVTEALRASLKLSSAEVWLWADGWLRPWLGDPGVEAKAFSLAGMSPETVVQAGLSGHGWLQVWMPQLLEGREGSLVRLAPMASAGELLGAIVVDRPDDLPVFSAQEERALVEVARQLGVALHNAQLDSALQASLDEVRRQAAEIQASRGRIVAAADQARRRIERNLHDGAQQHLVALGVRLKLADQLLDKGDDQGAQAALGQIAEAVEAAIQELRDLAHGIYPPLLADKGLGAALESAARRAVLPVTLRSEIAARYQSECEASIYFCVVEALQNAGKYAGDGASVTVALREDAGSLVFVVADDGAGFDVTAGKDNGAGFTNMLDRLGALGGTLRVESAPGKGTRVTGALPVTHI